MLNGNLNNFSVQIVVIALILLAVLQAFWGEKIEVNGGLGWDGQRYAIIVRDLDYMLSHEQMDNYHLNRISTIYIISKALKFLDIEYTHRSIVWAFSIFNLLCYWFSLFLSLKITEKINLSKEKQVLFLALLFGSFHQSKLIFYYPVLTDCLAWLFCLILIFLWISEYRFLLLMAIIVSFFVYPVLPIIGVILFLFNYKCETISVPIQLNFKFLFISLTVISISIILSIAIAYCYLPEKVTTLLCNSSFYQTNAILQSVNLFSILVIPAFITPILLISLLRNLREKWNFLTFILFQLVLFWVLFEVIKAIGIRIAPTLSKYTFHSYADSILLNSSHLPFKNWVSHFQYFGLISALPFLIGIKIAQNRIKLPTALILILGIFFIHSLDCESRHLFMYIPFIAFAAIKYISIKNNTNLLIILIGTLYFSKFWTQIGAIEDISAIPFENWQNYFKFQGPWMNSTSYLCGIINLILITVFSTVLFKKTENVN